MFDSIRFSQRFWILTGLVMWASLCGESSVARASCGDYLSMPGSHARGGEDSHGGKMAAVPVDCPCRGLNCDSEPDPASVPVSSQFIPHRTKMVFNRFVMKNQIDWIGEFVQGEEFLFLRELPGRRPERPPRVEFTGEETVVFLS